MDFIQEEEKTSSLSQVQSNFASCIMSVFGNIPLGAYDVRPQTGFTSGLLQKLVVSRSKVEEWVQHEKAKAERVAEEYRQQLMIEKAQIDSKTTTLLAVQLERGLSVKSEGDENDNAESIANRKSALEEQQTLLQSEIEKLKEEYQSREKRVQGEYIVAQSVNPIANTPQLLFLSLPYRNHYGRSKATWPCSICTRPEAASCRNEKDYH